MNLAGMPHAEVSNENVVNNGFYPELGTAEFITDYAIATEYANNIEQVKRTLVLVMLDVNQALARYRSRHWQQVEQLQDVSVDEIDGVNALILMYQRAVYCRAKAKLLISRLGETHRDQRAAQQVMASDNQEYWLQESDMALRQMMKVTRSGVELI
ncbi:phage head completion protein (GPL) [Moritella sp. JT01]|uniref:head completion/stabilization protein n=1 Tax=Moritella sp. JT01 TaxID=756698 RepID=UPI000796A0DB|nr:head completion/stabilization protein [Moritella sp. JT01]KXO12439.1 phage head completion protein (GPL) [Moritella sp. JT01]